MSSLISLPTILFFTDISTHTSQLPQSQLVLLATLLFPCFALQVVSSWITLTPDLILAYFVAFFMYQFKRHLLSEALKDFT